VLFTEGDLGSHFMRMYDVRRKNSRAVWSSKLEPFTKPTDGEVNRAKFSPDMIYLAVARNDDVTHVYDSRMVSKGPMHAFEHVGAGRNIPGNESYGIVEAHWVESSARSLGLVTGGTDGELRIVTAGPNDTLTTITSGCIRFWDTRKASDDPMNGTVIAETDFDVGYFSLGDSYKGEMSLVV
jgi:WD40 repeat protein